MRPTTFTPARRLLAALALGLTVSVAMAQEQVKATATAPKTVKPNAKFTAEVTLEVPEGWHIYAPGYEDTGVPTSIELVKPPKGWKLAKIVSPGDKELSGKVTFKVPVAVPKKVKGKQKITFAVTYQQCNDRMCLMPTTVQVPITTTVK